MEDSLLHCTPSEEEEAQEENRFPFEIASAEIASVLQLRNSF
jgi:hypothetical protein